MKVEKGEGFKPITITLETEKEAEDFWHVLNCFTSMSLQKYCKKREIDEIDNYDYWDKLNNVFTPEREK